MPRPASPFYVQHPARAERPGRRPLGYESSAYAPSRAAARPEWWGLALVVATFVLYTPVGPALISNELVVGPNRTSDLLAQVWSVGKYLMALGVAPALLVTTRAGLRPLSRCWPVFPFALFAAASIGWSAFPRESIRQVLNLFAILVITSTLVSRFGPAGFGRRVQIVTGALMIASLLTALLLPRLGVQHAFDVADPAHEGRWRGILLHKNLLGEFAVVALIYGLRSIRHETRPWQAFFLVARIATVACWVMSGSASALMGGGVALLFFLLMKIRVTANPLSMGGIVLGVAGLVSGKWLNVDQISGLLGRDATFTGRTEIWAYGWSLIQDRLLFGSGLATDGAAFGQMAKRRLFTSAMDLHSGYLDVLFNLGLVGAALMILAIGVALVRGYVYAQRHSGAEKDQAVIFMSVVVAAAVIATAETSPVAIAGDGAIGLWAALPALFQLRFRTRRLPSPAPILQPRYGSLRPGGGIADVAPR